MILQTNHSSKLSNLQECILGVSAWWQVPSPGGPQSQLYLKHPLLGPQNPPQLEAKSIW